jgi:hypothetical protein
VLKAVQAVQDVLAREPQTWQAADVLILLKQARTLCLERYFRLWWPATGVEKEAAAHVVQRFWWAAQHHDLLDYLGLTTEHIAWWREMAPLPPLPGLADFPGLDKVVPRRQCALQKVARRLVQPVAEVWLEPDIIKPGMWVHCDAGWGRIETLVDLVKRPLEQVERGNTFVRLYVVLRPDLDAELVEINISAARILFLKARAIFTCPKCNRFSAADPSLILNRHNEAAHDGTGASYKGEKKPERKLQHLRYKATAPHDALA